MKRFLLVIGAAALALPACEKKEPSAPADPKTVTGSIQDAAKSGADAVKDSAGKAADAVKDAAASAWAKVQESAQGYIDSLSKTTGVMEGVKDAPSATAALPQLKDLVPKLTAQAGALSALGAEDRAKLLAEYKDKLTPLVTKFKAEVDRLTKDPGLGTILGDTLKNIKLFE